MSQDCRKGGKPLLLSPSLLSFLMSFVLRCLFPNILETQKSIEEKFHPCSQPPESTNGHILLFLFRSVGIKETRVTDAVCASPAHPALPPRRSPSPSQSHTVLNVVSPGVHLLFYMDGRLETMDGVASRVLKCMQNVQTLFQLCCSISPFECTSMPFIHSTRWPYRPFPIFLATTSKAASSPCVCPPGVCHGL